MLYFWYCKNTPKKQIKLKSTDTDLQHIWQKISVCLNDKMKGELARQYYFHGSFSHWKQSLKKKTERRKKSHSPKLFTSLASRFRQIVVLLQSLHEQSETGLIYK